MVNALDWELWETGAMPEIEPKFFLVHLGYFDCKLFREGTLSNYMQVHCLVQRDPDLRF